MEPNHSLVIVAFSSCHQLNKIHWTFWRINSLILLPQTLSITNSLQLNINSRVYHLDEQQQLHDIFRYNLEDINYVSKSLGNTNLTNFHDTVNYIWERRTDLSTIHLNIVYIHYPPFTMIKSAQNIKGYLGQLFVMLQEKLQFKFTLSEQENNCWGSLIANGSYSCMFGKLQRGESNWALTGTWCYVLVLQMQLILFFFKLIGLKTNWPRG